MFDIYKSYLDNKNYYIILAENMFYIKNYSKIINIDNNELIINIKNKTLKINGDSITVIKSIDHELMVNGKIESIKIYD